MAGTARHRVLDQETPVSGVITFFGVNPNYQTMHVGRYVSCDDVVGNREGANFFSVREQLRFFPYLEGTNGAWEMSNFPLGYHTTNNPDPDLVFSPPDSGELEDLAWDCLAKTNPSKSHVNLPAFIGEMKDLPSLVKQSGEGILRTLASANLSWKFGFAPLLGDIRKMCNFIDASEKKFNELRNLRDKKALRKRVDLGTEEVVGALRNEIFHSQGAWITGTRQDVFTRKEWASVEWKLDPGTDIPEKTDQELLKLARKLTYGLNTYGAVEAAWELIPWSWLADWFGNTQQFIAAHNNSVPCTWGRMCYMATTKGKAVVNMDLSSLPSSVSLKGGQVRIWVTKKVRYPMVPVSPIPLPRLPILDGGKWSILASLAVLRLPKSLVPR